MDAFRAVGHFDSAQPRDNPQPARQRDPRQASNLVPSHIGRARGGPRAVHVPDQHRHCQDPIWLPACRR